MENDLIKNIWNSQVEQSQTGDPSSIIRLAKSQRRHQLGGILIMSMAVFILIGFMIYISNFQWNNFSLGIFLMISTLLLRIFVEITSLFVKQKKLINLDHKSFHLYLKNHYKNRLWINYLLTPVCILFYTYGFFLLLPYFKEELSHSFYRYILFSGFISIGIITGIIFYRIMQERKELNFLKKSFKQTGRQ